MFIFIHDVIIELLVRDKKKQLALNLILALILGKRLERSRFEQPVVK